MSRDDIVFFCGCVFANSRSDIGGVSKYLEW